MKWRIPTVIVASVFVAFCSSIRSEPAAQKPAKAAFPVVCPFLELGACEQEDDCCLYYAFEHDQDCYTADLVYYEQACNRPYGVCDEPNTPDANCVNTVTGGGAKDAKGCCGDATGSGKAAGVAGRFARLPFTSHPIPVDANVPSFFPGGHFQPLGAPFVVEVSVREDRSKYAMVYLYKCNTSEGDVKRTTIVGVGFECKEAPSNTAPRIHGKVRKVNVTKLTDKGTTTRQLAGYVELQLGITKLLVKVRDADAWHFKR